MSTLRDQFLSQLSYQPDAFQVKAMDSIDADASVLVAAPTGSGKTLIAEYGIARAQSLKRRAFYTTPIKALSNQKFRDLGELYGAHNVGLVTGDNAINADAPVVVMTTEVLRNMIYASSHRLNDLGVVILDEVHYLQDAYRGPVWEEVIIQLDPEVQLVCLSATVSNADEVCEWLSTVRGRTDVVVETTRPIELVNHFAVHDKASDKTEMFHTIVGGEPNRHVQRLLSGGRPNGGRQGQSKKARRFSPPTRPETVELLEDNAMLPAIVFIFSRAQCEDAVASCMRAGIILTSADEESQIIEIVERHCESLSDDDRVALEYSHFLDDIGTGVSCHHAGMIPMFKEAVEECFVKGLVKVVFATETLAVGINMPARAVVIEKLTKYTGDHHQLLRASEFTQLTGRAGRRGLDDIGHAISLWNPFVTFEQVAGLALSKSFRLTSAFRPTFNMAVNMVRNHSEDGAHHILNLSFAQFQADRDVVTSEALLEKKRRELALLERSAPLEYEAESTPTGASSVEAEIALRALRPGDVVMFDASNIRGRGLVLSTAARRAGIRLTVLTPSKKTLEVMAKDLRSLPLKGAHVDLPIPFEPTRTEFIKEAVSRLVKAKVDDTATRAIEFSGESRIADSPISAKSIKRLRREIDQMEDRSRNRAGSVSARFMDVVELLEDLGYIDDWSLTPKGETLSGIFHESDLLVVEVMDKGILNGLSVNDLVAVLSTLIYEPRGGDSGGPTRWPSDIIRQRFKRIEKLSQRLQDAQRERGLHVHRSPHGGLAFECAGWASGKPLSKILDPELTPGDFVRSIRQLIDLLRQIVTTSNNEELRTTAELAIRSIDRGVVAAAQGANAS
ncbi:MAG: DEAD/DEAH box helicase [Acidimicrobiaceae bacterium]|jgi:ATP-dependent RNA helicase HelY|nr:DEAD/DEAH box helicase [Ilumatobacteraceae bacterium]